MATERFWVLIARKLANEASENELQELAELLRNHPNEHYSIDLIQEQWRQRNNYNTADAARSFDKTWDKIQLQELIKNLENYSTVQAPKNLVNPSFNGIKKWGSILAAAMLVAGGIWLFALTKKEKATLIKANANEISTKYGSKTKLILPDSTQVWLNGGSKLSYSSDYGQTLREVKLVGEAYFDVVHNAEKPFIIHTSKMDIKVLGTAFNVKCYPGEKSMETSLIRGSIEVTLKNRQSEKIMLKPNEKLVLDTTDSLPEGQASNKSKKVRLNQKPIVAIEHVTYDELADEVVESSWVANKLMFRAESFEELALQMERWYNVHIHFKNEGLKQIRLTGTFEKESISQALTYLQLTAHFKYKMQNDSINIFL